MVKQETRRERESLGETFKKGGKNQEENGGGRRREERY